MVAAKIAPPELEHRRNGWTLEEYEWQPTGVARLRYERIREEGFVETRTVTRWQMNWV